jgi:hypothetical protein
MSEMKLVEQCSGEGDLSRRQGEVIRRVRYRIARSQGMQSGNGLPIPGLHRIEGAIDVESGVDLESLVGIPLTLRLEDGRALGITLADDQGRVLAEGHGPMRCLCC